MVPVTLASPSKVRSGSENVDRDLSPEGLQGEQLPAVELLRVGRAVTAYADADASPRHRNLGRGHFPSTSSKVLHQLEEVIGPRLFLELSTPDTARGFGFEGKAAFNWIGKTKTAAHYVQRMQANNRGARGAKGAKMTQHSRREFKR
jgi:hypothetical protein